jgi:hypothetical protein
MITDTSRPFNFSNFFRRILLHNDSKGGQLNLMEVAAPFASKASTVDKIVGWRFGTDGRYHPF